jgi:hypothetical protein
MDPKAMMSTGKSKTIRKGIVAEDRRLYDACDIVIASTGTDLFDPAGNRSALGGAGDEMGKLWANYRVIFLDPVLDADEGTKLTRIALTTRQLDKVAYQAVFNVGIATVLSNPFDFAMDLPYASITVPPRLWRVSCSAGCDVAAGNDYLQALHFRIAIIIRDLEGNAILSYRALDDSDMTIEPTVESLLWSTTYSSDSGDRLELTRHFVSFIIDLTNFDNDTLYNVDTLEIIPEIAAAWTKQDGTAAVANATLLNTNFVLEVV